MDIRRGIIRAFDSGTYLADVQIVGSMATMLIGVPVAKQIGADLLMSGTRCGVLFFDETNPSDACVILVYDGAPGAWVTSALIKDGEVAVGDLAFDPATQAELDAHAALPSVHHAELTPTQHDARDHTPVASTIDLSELGSKAHSELTGVGPDDHHPHPCARVYNDANITVPPSATQVLPFNSERFDTDDIHDVSANTTRLTCKTAGKYLITALVCWESNISGFRQIAIVHSTDGYIGIVRQRAHGLDLQEVSALWDMAVDDYVEVKVYQTSGGYLDVPAAANYSPEFMMVRVG